MTDPAFIIGIDLGTTNSAVSWADLRADPGRDKGIRLFQVPQLTGAGEVSEMSVLPCFCYLPGKYDVAPEAISLPWDASQAPSRVVGTFARDHGAKIPSRLVSSAKSWLCHGQADRRSRILPWGAGEGMPRISPVEATAAYLGHIRSAWNHAQSDEDLYLENQYLIITVPASFDEAARDLTLEAAKLAGLHDVILLEEPLAAFYSWLIRYENNWRDYIAPGELVLVCDVGGGTTDFTLITLRETEGTPRFERIAVGDHLILGGDNIDLALARHVEQQFGPGANLTADRWKTLCHLCRQAKENILNQGTDRETITMMGEGSRLIGGTLTAQLDRSTLEHILLESFFPVAERQNPVQESQARGVSEFGLPFAADSAITRHIGYFLEQHRPDVENFLGPRSPFPDRVLFNGGSLKSGLVQEQIRHALRSWFTENDESLPGVLENRNLDIAVALGAAYYGLVRFGRGVRVGSGSPRSYYLGIESREQEEAGQPQAICLVERGMDEGTRIALTDRKFEVLANRPVAFDLFSSSYRSGDRSGERVTVDESMTRLPPIQTVIQFGRKGVQTAIPVQLEAEYTETGVLEIWCRSLSTGHRWRLNFQLRQMPVQPEVAETEVFDHETVEAAIAAVDVAFAPDAAESELSGLAKTITGIIQRSRDYWPLSFLRSIADALLARMGNRRHTPKHEIRWLNLTGFCLRPGFGDGFDSRRIQSLWKIYKSGVNFKKNQQAVTEWWILWRRVAGGLSAGQQRQFAQDCRAVLMPKKGTRVRVPLQERIEMWMALANMERLAAEEKSAWGDALLGEMNPKKSRPQLFWSLSRIGARELLYGPVDRVVPPGKAAQWADFVMQQQWKHPGAAGTALARIGRKTGDRARDLDEKTLAGIVGWLEARGMEAEVRVVKSVVPMKKVEASAMFGESLPAGLILHE